MPCQSSSSPSSMPSQTSLSSWFCSRMRRNSIRVLTISCPILISAGTAAAPKPEAMAKAISTTWVNAAMTMLY